MIIPLSTRRRRRATVAPTESTAANRTYYMQTALTDERWQPFATRHTHKPIPRETLFEFLRGHDRFLCELRDHGEWSIEAQFYKNEEYLCAHRLPNRAAAVTWAERERSDLQKGQSDVGDV